MADWPTIKNETPLLIQSSIDTASARTEKLHIEVEGGAIRKVSCPINDFEDPELTLWCLKEFDEITTQYALNVAEQYLHCPSTLGVSSRQDWDAFVATLPANERNAANLVIGRNELLRRVFDKRSFDNLKTYLNRLRKPSEMKARTLFYRLKVIFVYSSMLPQGEPFTAREQKKYYIEMFPLEQQKDFERVHTNYDGLSLADISEFFATYDTSSNNNRNRNSKRRNNNDGDDDSRHNDRNNNNGARKNNKKGRKNNNNKNYENNNNGTGLTNPCREHSYLGNKNHEWSKCIYNSRCASYHPEKAKRYYEAKRTGQLKEHNGSRTAGANGNGGTNSTQHQGQYGSYFTVPYPTNLPCPVVNQTLSSLPVPPGSHHVHWASHPPTVHTTYPAPPPPNGDRR